MSDIGLWYDFVKNPGLKSMGEGDYGPTLSFTRATGATVVGHDGLIRLIHTGEPRFTGARRRANYLEGSNAFTGSEWITTGGTITNDGSVKSFDGTRPAFLFTEASSTSTNDTRNPISTSTHYGKRVCFSVYAKDAATPSGRFIQLRPYGVGAGAAWVSFDLSDGSLSGSGGTSFVSAGSQEVGGGWYRYWLVMDDVSVNAADGYQIYIQPTGITESSSYTGDGREVCYICCGQLEEGAYPTTYIDAPTAAAFSHEYTETLLGYHENLLQYNTDLSQASWSKDAYLTVTANATEAPDGTMTGWKLSDNAGAGGNQTINIGRGVTLQPNRQYIVSWYAKADQQEWIYLNPQNFAGETYGCYYHLSGAGATAQLTPESDFASITPVGKGWYRCVLGFTPIDADAAGTLQWYLADGAGDVNVATDGTSSVFFWRPQVEEARGYTTPTSPIVTGSSVRTDVLDYGGRVVAERKGLLQEEARTNICLQSEDFGTTWTANAGASVVTNQTTAPDGSQTADKFIDDGVSASPASMNLSQSVTVATSTTYTYSCFLKADQLTWAVLYAHNFTTPANGGCYFNLGTGEVGTADTGITGAIEYYGNGWYRCSITFTTDGADTAGNLRIYCADSDLDLTVDIDGTSSIFVWGAQLEAGAFPTSYIPTTTTSVTRNFEDISSTDVSWYDQAGGTFFTEARALPSASKQGDIVSLLGTSFNSAERISMYRPGNNNTGFYVATGGAGQASLGVSGSQYADATDDILCAGVARANDFRLYADGTAGTPDTAGSMPSIASMTIGRLGATTEPWNGHIKKVLIWNEPKENQFLDDITTDGIDGVRGPYR